MRLSDFIIIYLACGAPFAVQQFLSSRRKTGLRKIGSVVLAFLLWPAYAAIATSKLFAANAHASAQPAGNSSAKLDSLQCELETALLDGPAPLTLFEFRDVFMRYTGLAANIDQPEISDGPAEVFAISGSTAPNAAAACFRRKNLAKLNRHFENARADFVETVNSIASEHPDGGRVYDYAAGVASLVGDADTSAALRSMLTFSSIDPEKADQVGEIWNTVSQTRSVAS